MFFCFVTPWLSAIWAVRNSREVLDGVFPCRIDPFMTCGLFASGGEIGFEREGWLLSISSLDLAAGSAWDRGLWREERVLCLTVFLSLACQLSFTLLGIAFSRSS